MAAVHPGPNLNAHRQGAMALLYNGNTNIRDLPALVMRELRQALDSGPEDCNWRTFCALMENHYTFRQSDIESLAVKFQAGHSPSESIFCLLGGKGMTCQELVHYLDRLRLERVLLRLKSYEPIMILRDPPSNMQVVEGEAFTLRVEATGFPYPRYQWFREREEVVGAIESTLNVIEARMQHEGTYCCRVVNHSEPNLAKFSDYCSVVVLPSPQELPRACSLGQSQNCWGPTSGTDPLPKLSSTSSGSQGTQSAGILNEDFSRISLYSKDSVITLPVIEEHPKNKEIRVGESFQLECQAQGLLPLRYVWFHNSDLVSENDNQGVFRVKEATIADAGNYYCIVKNDFGEAKSRWACVVINALPIQEMINLQVTEPSSIAPLIQRHPTSCTVDIGGDVLFTCEAIGTPPLQYQWFHNGSLIQGATHPHYKVLNMREQSKEGLYQCLVTNNMNANGQFSNAAMLRINRNRPPVQKIYTATDKVALLIGNFDYMNERPLKAPKTDIHMLGKAFREVDFKVVSLLNLSRAEMMSAIYHFSELLDDGVYGVFYFCGHGFEENGKCYLIPWDAPHSCSTKDSVCSDYVLKEMQRKKPTLCALILDICRRSSKAASPEVSQSQPTFLDQSFWSTGNTIICYATSMGMSAFEDTNMRRGILVSHLARYIVQPLSVETIFSAVKRDVGKDHRLIGKNAVQLPEMRSNLTDIERSFSDKVDYHGHTAAFHSRQRVWDRAHKKPESKTLFLKPPHLAIEVELDFQAEFSNVLNIFITVKDKGQAEECVSWISKIPSNLSCSEPIIVSKEKGEQHVTTKNELKDIQKLRCDLVVTIAARYTLPGSKEQMTEETTFNLHKPLVSVLELGEPVPDHYGYRQPSESVDPVTQLSSSTSSSSTC